MSLLSVMAKAFADGFRSEWRRQHGGYCAWKLDETQMGKFGDIQVYTSGCGHTVTLIKDFGYQRNRYCGFCGCKWRRP